MMKITTQLVGEQATTWCSSMVKKVELQYMIRVLFIVFFVIACSYGLFITIGFNHSLNISTRTEAGNEMLKKYYYAYWTISRHQLRPHVVIPDSIGDYKKMEDQFEYFVGKNDSLGRLTLSERWTRKRSHVVFPVPDMELEIDQRRYFKVLENKKLVEISYLETEGKSQYLLIHKYDNNFPGMVGIYVSHKLVSQYLKSVEEYVYEGDQRNATKTIKHAVESYQ